MSSIPNFLSQSEQYLIQMGLPQIGETSGKTRGLGEMTESLGLAALCVGFSLTSLVAVLSL
ncbi:hypothetical protein [Roseateles sp. PN1]|uniref:hypothetical protein n=1 Tax=Roseateles sp. PN1 TaxID=3137372 RepID=UPI001E188E24|nr:hypothetical protein [Burkholderiaceae bacterium]